MERDSPKIPLSQNQLQKIRLIDKEIKELV